MHPKSNKGDINLSLLITTFLVCIVIAVGVAVFHSQYYPTKFLEYKSSDISDRFLGSKDFAVTAKNLLNSRNDITYLKQLDRNGVLEESFGNDKASNTEKFVVNGPNNKTIIMGLKTIDGSWIDTYALIWSLLIGSGLALLLVTIISMKGSKPVKSLKKLEGAMDRISQGDFTARLEIDSSSDEEINTINTYQSFNRMADSLNKNYKTEGVQEEQIEDIDPEVKEIVGEMDEEIVEISEEIVEEEKVIDEVEESAESEQSLEETEQELFTQEEEDEEYDLKPETDQHDLDDEQNGSATEQEENADQYVEEVYAADSER